MFPVADRSRSCYSTTLKFLNEPLNATDLCDTFKKLAHRQTAVVPALANVMEQIVALDLQRVAPPMQPTWSRLQTEFTQMHAVCRNNAGYLHGRFNMFSAMILPYMAKNLTNETPHMRREKAQVLKSFVEISLSHAAYTASCVETFLDSVGGLTSFHHDIVQLSSQRMSTGHQERLNLCSKFQQHVAVTKELYHDVRQSNGIVVLFNNAFALIFRTSKVKIDSSDCKYLEPEIFERFDIIYSEAVHANYAAQVSQRQTDALAGTRAAISSFAFDVSALFNHAMIFLTSAWLVLENDCSQLANWLQSDDTDVPACLEMYMNHGRTLYGPIVTALETYLAECSHPSG
ncbi:hypothetical protein CPB85DRAFT_1432044 [Mucidula mucida]|nr:hypothetical protein CPB85DRAFT_1432044 [Mucidula mucida]